MNEYDPKVSRWGSCPAQAAPHNHVVCNCPPCVRWPSEWWRCVFSKEWLTAEQIQEGPK